MRWSNFTFLIVMIGLAACSPSDKKSDGAQAKAAPAPAQPIGHTPKPVQTAIASGPFLFHGYACGSDCISHQQGYSWASAHQIANPRDCRGTSESFIEGCRAFAGVAGPFGGREIDPSFPHMIGTD